MNAKTEKLYDERTKASLDPKHAPVSLPPGSFDIEKLQSGLDAAVKGKAEDRDEKVDKAVRAAASDLTLESLDADKSAMPGFVDAEVKHPEIDGLTETTKVFDAKAAAKAEAAAEPASQPAGTSAGSTAE